MKTVVRLVAIGLMGFGLVLVAIGGVTWLRANDGLESLEAVYEAQNVTLSYNDQGELVDRGTVEGAQAIRSLLQDDWKFPVVERDLNPDDPLVNTPTELMYQLAAVTYHTIHGTQTVTLAEDVEYNGEVFPAGTYEFEVDGRYWTDFDRQHPIEGVARGLAWTGTAHGLVGELSAGVAADNLAGFAHFTGWRTVLEGLAIGLAGFGLLALSLQMEQAGGAVSTRARELADIT